MTKPITKFTKSNLKKIDKEIDAAIKKVADKYGLNYESTGGTFFDGELNAKFNLTTRAENSEDGLTESGRNYLKFCESRGLRKNWLNVPFNHKNDTIVIIGWNHSRPKNCIALSVNGKTGPMSGESFILQYSDQLNEAFEASGNPGIS